MKLPSAVLFWVFFLWSHFGVTAGGQSHLALLKDRNSKVTWDAKKPLYLYSAHHHLLILTNHKNGITDNHSRTDRRQVLVHSHAGSISFHSSCCNMKCFLGRIKKECRRLTVWVTVCLLCLSSSWIPTALRDTGFRLRVLHYRNYPSAHFSPALFGVHTPNKPLAGLGACSQPSLAPSHSYCARSQSHPLFLPFCFTHTCERSISGTVVGSC